MSREFCQRRVKGEPVGSNEMNPGRLVSAPVSLVDAAKLRFVVKVVALRGRSAMIPRPRETVPAKWRRKT